MWLATVLAWIVTYAIHSTLLLGTAWALLRLRRLRRAPRLAEAVWRGALLGGIVTASLHVALGAPLWQTPLVETPAEVRVTAASAPSPGRVPEPRAVSPDLASQPVPAVEATAPLALDTATPGAAAPASEGVGSNVWLLLGVWPLVALALVIRERRLGRQLARCLADRRTVVRPDLAALLHDLVREAALRRRVRLTVTPALSSPVALGTRRPEICLPLRAVEDLEPRHLEAMLAHEVAHVTRADAAWLHAYRAVTILFFFQPLNHLAVSRLRDTSEMLCDAWAARRDGGRLALAECLTAVADWILERGVPATAPAMAHRPSLLGERVRRLLASGPLAAGPRRKLAVLSALAPLALVLALAPGVQAAMPAVGPSAPAEVVTSADTDDPLSLLDADLDALGLEIEEALVLLRDAGREDLAARLEARRDAIAIKRVHLGRVLESPNDESGKVQR